MQLGLMNVKGNDDDDDVVLLIVAILIAMMLLLLMMMIMMIVMTMMIMIAELWRACGAPCVSKSTHPRKFGNFLTVHRPPALPPSRPPALPPVRPSAPQENQCSISHFLASLGARED